MRQNLLRIGFWVVLLACLSGQAGAQYGGQGGNTYTNFETRITELENQIRSLNGRLEQVEWQNKQLQAVLERFQGDAETRFGQLEKNQSQARPDVAVNAAAPNDGYYAGNGQSENTPSTRRSRAWRSGGTNMARAMPDGGNAIDEAAAADDTPPPSDRAVEGQLGKLYMSDGRVRGADSTGSAPPLPHVPAGYGLTPREQYDRAFDLLRTANYDDAEQAFRSFIDKNPKDKMIDNAKYWLGETHYARAQYDAAAVAFADAYQTAPKGTKAADSLLKLGMALAGMGKHDDACTTLVELKNQIPGAPSSVKNRAMQEAKKLKCKV